MPSPNDETSEDRIILLAAQLRQAVRGCCAHYSGPVNIYRKCQQSYRNGSLSAEQLRRVGELVIENSRQVQSDAAGVGNSSVVEREQDIIEFVAALFAIDNDIRT
jgi:hypothetical protein